MSDLIHLFKTFVRVVEVGSFTAVATEQNTSQATISRQVASLEEHLGCLLFQRTTRSLTLTDDGQVFYGHVSRTLETVAEAETAVGRRKGKPSGTLKLACSGVFGRLHIMPRLGKFMTAYPDLIVDLIMHDGFSDLVEEGIDLAVRVGEVTDPSLVVRRIGTSHRIVVATPEYFQRSGLPISPADLGDHNCIVYSRLSSGAKWTFKTERGPFIVPITGGLHVNNSEGVRAAILNGVGLGYVPDWHFVENEVANVNLMRVLT